MPIEFATSPRSSLGIEWEIALVDQESRELASIGPEIMQELHSQDLHGAELATISGELLQNTVELVSSPHHSVPSAVDELGSLARAVFDSARKRGATPICSGTHPFSHWGNQTVTEHERYQKFIEQTQWWGRNMLIWGIHVHLGVSDRSRVPALVQALLVYLPHLQALSASSPFWVGEATGYVSNRSLWFQQLPTAGIPYTFESWEEYEGIMDDLVKTNIISDVTEARWDIRPAPKWGTIEVRVCDGVSTLWEIGALAALTQCLFEYLNQRMDRGENIPRLQPWFIRENKWRSARYGLDAEIIVHADGTTATLREHIAVILPKLLPIAEQLRCVAELQSVTRIIDEGSGAERQLRTLDNHGGIDAEWALKAVVDEIADEFAESVQGLNQA